MFVIYMIQVIDAFSNKDIYILLLINYEHLASYFAVIRTFDPLMQMERLWPLNHAIRAKNVIMHVHASYVYQAH
jgi:hypothetical protein